MAEVNPADILAPAGRVPESIPDHAPTRTDVASRALRSGWLKTNPQAQAAMSAIALHYENVDLLLGDLQLLGGNSIYVSPQVLMKELHSKVPLPCRKWVKRHASPGEYEDLGFDRFTFLPPNQRDQFVGYGSRVWLCELWLRGWDAKPIAQDKNGLLTVATPVGDWFLAASAWGEASDYNCELINGAKLKADPRVLDRQAIKRGMHECLREVVSLSLRGSKGIDQPTLYMAGVRMIVEDGNTIENPMQAYDLAGRGDMPGEPGDGDAPWEGDDRRTTQAQADRLMDSIYAEYKGKFPPREEDALFKAALATSDPRGFLEGELDRRTTGRASVGPAAGPPAIITPPPAAAGTAPHPWPIERGPSGTAKADPPPDAAAPAAAETGRRGKPGRPRKTPAPTAETGPAASPAASAVEAAAAITAPADNPPANPAPAEGTETSAPAASDPQPPETTGGGAAAGEELGPDRGKLW